MEKHICQSCSMPMVKSAEFGVNRDGSRNEEYCVFCFKDGKFTHNKSLEEVVAQSANYAKELGITEEEAISYARKVLPSLKRWRNWFDTNK